MLSASLKPKQASSYPLLAKMAQIPLTAHAAKRIWSAWRRNCPSNASRTMQQTQVANLRLLLKCSSAQVKHVNKVHARDRIAF
jgi:hypothetical protein